MKADRAITTVGVLAAITGLLAISTGRPIMGCIILGVSIAIFRSRGGGSINDRSIYEKEVKTELTIDEIFAELKDMKTALGSAWIAEHKGYPGDSIVFGPSMYKDIVVISRKDPKINIKHITLMDNIVRNEEDEYRFDNLINTKETQVTPANYSEFAGFKLASVVLVKQLYELIKKLGQSDGSDAASEPGVGNIYYHNSSEGWFKDADGREVLRAECSYNPFNCSVYSADGEEMAAVKARRFDQRGRVLESAGFDISADGESYGEINPYKEKRESGYIASTKDGEFKIKLFPACGRANISVNYTVERDGALKAVIGGSPKLEFQEAGISQNDLVLSYDDDYLVLYAVLELFIMTLGSDFLR